MVTPGYFGRPDLTAEAFDADGFYRSGDAVAFANPADRSAGLVFRGRIAEDFKLATGTFVMARPPDLDAGEITDKGYANQRKVLACRSGLVAMLYADQVTPGVVVAEPGDVG
jgi:long-subunit acyl-CoA synthetase (AMP-forming)